MYILHNISLITRFISLAIDVNVNNLIKDHLQLSQETAIKTK